MNEIQNSKKIQLFLEVYESRAGGVCEYRI